MAQQGKNPPAMQGDSGDTVSIPGSLDPWRMKFDNPIQYSCLKNLVTEESGKLPSKGLKKSWT